MDLEVLWKWEKDLQDEIKNQKKELMASFKDNSSKYEA